MYIFSSTTFILLMYHIKNTMSRKNFYIFFIFLLKILFLLVLTVFYFLYKSKIFDLEKIVDTFSIICYNVSVK
ncbi:MAG TPA: hypothetical protein DEQ96_01930 [Fusobacterium sp.]|uniref:Histidine kinase n=2 Tax=Fusobacterium TaxID=848 RepID=A0A323TZJ7_FUSNU|nr:hypothetical protein [Fusobacterium nucleatum]PCR84590.1 hypothetical protein CQA79_09080 [Fusobacterium nucleatum]PHI17099.1 hypothetical protein CBG56_02960 [Fusobacterium polymorphum]PZA03826.1 hypothetical protein DNF10_09545 [Fusobacterium nucleatum]HCE31872.1 hypothetical protein [Fusobacterium sp.]